MKILKIRTSRDPAAKVVARFDLELSDGVRLYDLKLTSGPNGWRVYGPTTGMGAAVTFPPVLVERIVVIAHEAIASHAKTAA